MKGAAIRGEAVSNAAVVALLADDRGYDVAADDEVCELTGYRVRS